VDHRVSLIRLHHQHRVDRRQLLRPLSAAPCSALKPLCGPLIARSGTKPGSLYWLGRPVADLDPPLVAGPLGPPAPSSQPGARPPGALFWGVPHPPPPLARVPPPTPCRPAAAPPPCRSDPRIVEATMSPRKHKNRTAPTPAPTPPVAPEHLAVATTAPTAFP